MKTIHNVKIDLLTPGLHPRVYAVQDDICTREVQISLYSGSVSWTPTSGAGVAVGYRKGDGTVGIYDTLPDGSSAVSISGNVVTVILAAQMLTAAGTVEAALTLAEKSGNQITTFAFDVIVSANPGSGAIKSEDYFNYVNPKIQAVIEQAAAATTAANTAASRANASAELAEDAYDLADTANQKVDTLREVVSKLHSNIVETARGEVIQLSDASDLELAGLRIFGKTEQFTTMGKNLFPLAPFEPVTKGGITASYENGGIRISGNLTATENNFTIVDLGDAVTLPAGVYTVSFNTLSQPQVTLRFITTPNPIDAQNATERIKTLTLTEPATVKCIVYRNSRYAQNIPSEPIFIQIEAGTTATEREPYTGGKPSPSPEYPQELESVGKSVNVTLEGEDTQPQALTVTTPNGLPGIPVPSGGNYTDSNGRQWICDEIDFEKGVYVQRVYRQTYIGSSKETWKKATQVIKKDRFYTQYMVPNTTKPCLCNMAGWISEPSYDENGKCFISFNDDDDIWRFEIITSDYGTFVDAPAWRRYLGEHPMEVLYVLDEEKETPLSEIDPDALAQYATLHTNYPNTTISNDAGAGMEVKYVADTQKYVDKKFEALEAAIANLI